jgi:uncharacterized protein YebE (UPF0316 family)
LVSETKVLASGLVTVINIFIWYYVLRIVVDDINNVGVIIVYALGCAAGTMLTTAYFNLKDKKRAKKHFSWPKRKTLIGLLDRIL